MLSLVMSTIDVAHRNLLVKKGKQLEYVTVLYNSLEGLISIVSGVVAGSIALIGFGIDSAIEVTSGVVLLWRLYADVNLEKRESVERRSLKIIGICFLLLSVYVTYDSVAALIQQEAPDESIPGILLAISSVIVMPILARRKRVIAREIKSGALNLEAKQTELCAYLSSILLGGLVLNLLLGWWWADPIAALVMVPIMVREGAEALKGKHCEDCTPHDPFHT